MSYASPSTMNRRRCNSEPIVSPYKTNTKHNTMKFLKKKQGLSPSTSTPSTIADSTVEEDHEHASVAQSPSSPVKKLEFLVTPDEWYSYGERVWYNTNTKKVIQTQGNYDFVDANMDMSWENQDNSGNAAQNDPSLLQVFRRVVTRGTQLEQQQQQEEAEPQASLQRWMTFLPGDPEGSFGFHAVEEALALAASESERNSNCSSMNSSSNNTSSPSRRLPKGRCDTGSTEDSIESLGLTSSSPPTPDHSNSTQDESQEQQEQCSVLNDNLPRLYLEYVGQGNSDSLKQQQPQEHQHPYFIDAENDESLTKQRADLVEALWEEQGIKRTVVVSVGESSSLVVMELLQRQRTRLAAGCPFPKVLHVLSLNGRFVAKTRQTGQLPTVTQLLRSDRMGASLAQKAKRSDFTMSQCLGPYLRGCSSKQVRKQVASIVRRNNGTRLLVDAARIVDDHLHSQHRYRWHLPHLLKVFAVDQGITFSLLTTAKSRKAAQQVDLVQRQLVDYELEDIPHVHFETVEGTAAASTTSFLLDSPTQQLDVFVQAVRQLQKADIPMSFNANRQTQDDGQLLRWRRNSSMDEEEFENMMNEAQQQQEDNDSYLNDDDNEFLEGAGESLDTRLETEIVFDTRAMDEDDFDLF